MLIFFTIHLFLTSVTGQAEDWRLDKDKNDIKVFTRKVEGYPIREFMAQASVNTSFDQIIHLFEDVTNYTDWIPDIDEAEIIEKVGDSTYYYRMVINAPYPVTDRDLVSEMKFVLEDENTLRIEIQALPDLVEEVDGLVRIPFSTGYWEFKRNGAELEITNQFLSDPGSGIPAWVANMFLTNNPYNTIKNLKEKIE